MGKLLLGCIFLHLFFSVALGALHPNWRLAWYDDFNGDKLDTTKWTARDKPGNYGEKEQQYYHPDMVNVSNGNLVITSNRTNYKDFKFMSGWVDSKDKFYSTHGRWEFRAKMASGQGVWPAIWTISQTTCVWQGGEFDMAEFRGQFPQRGVGNYHYGAGCATARKSVGFTYTTSTTDYDKDFHTYAMEWNAENVTWYVDDTQRKFMKASDLVDGIKLNLTPHFWIINTAVGGNYATTPADDVPFPTYHLVDYVRFYQWRPSCQGANVCSKHGCCVPQNVTCRCDAGWAGGNCEFYTGSMVNNFDWAGIEYTPVVNVWPNGWGNGFAMFRDTNKAVSSNGLTLTLTNASCPASCGGNMSYSGGGWESANYYSYGTFSFLVQSTAISGTAVAIGAAGESTVLEQISIVLMGVNKTKAQIITWHTGYQYLHTIIDLGFDASLAVHNYSFTYNPDFLEFFVDGKSVYATAVVIPNVSLSLNAYYTAQPQWYGPFTYTRPSTVRVVQAAWLTSLKPAVCTVPTTTTSTTKAPTTTTTGLPTSTTTSATATATTSATKAATTATATTSTTRPPTTTSTTASATTTTTKATTTTTTTTTTKATTTTTTIKATTTASATTTTTKAPTTSGATTTTTKATTTTATATTKSATATTLSATATTRPPTTTSDDTISTSLTTSPIGTTTGPSIGPSTGPSTGLSTGPSTSPSTIGTTTNGTGTTEVSSTNKIVTVSIGPTTRVVTISITTRSGSTGSTTSTTDEEDHLLSDARSLQHPFSFLRFSSLYLVLLSLFALWYPVV